MKPYSHLFFDLDHTLWHYEANCMEALKILYKKYNLYAMGIESLQKLYEVFFTVNHKLWNLYDSYQITSEELRSRRFKEILEIFSIDNNILAQILAEEYIDITHRLPTLIPGAIEILEYLQPNYTLHIITNGFENIQRGKMEASGITHYFKTFTCSAIANARKPEAKIFEYALNHANALATNSLMIGDNVDTDIAGAITVGMDAVYFNPNNNISSNIVKTQVKHLLHLKHFL